MENKLLGYVFLVDHNLKIRWAGCGPATPKETEDLRTATAVLMRRMQEEQAEEQKQSIDSGEEKEKAMEQRANSKDVES
jgi:ATPase complex subunit ATP10